MTDAGYYSNSIESEIGAAYEKVDAIGKILAASRSEAIAGRQDSGIEDEWLEDEEYYEGVDDANRSEVKAWKSKPLGQQSPADDDEEKNGSTIFLNITAPYVDAVASRMGDMLLPTDDRSWHIKPTPIPEFVDISKGKLSRSIKDAIAQEMPNDPEGQQQKQAEIIAQMKDEMERAQESARLAEDQIWDWHVECDYHSHNRRVIADCCKVGSGVLKGPIPVKATKAVFMDGELRRIEDVRPASMRINYRNFFPDPACGENIHDGSFTWERDDITMAKLSKLKRVPGYITAQIDQCIREGPQEATKEFAEGSEFPGLKASTDTRRRMFEIWYYYGMMRSDELAAIDMLAGREPGEYRDEYVFVNVTMVNNRVIKAEISHLDVGVFPYDVMVWNRRTGMPWGIGIARKMRPAQRIVVGAVRHMMDNAGIAGGPMLFVNDALIQPHNGVYEVRPWKMWVAGTEYEPGMDMKEAIQFLQADMIQEELQAVVEMGLKFAEDLTGLPVIMQGQTNQRTPDTLGGMIMQNNNASSVLRTVAKNYDDLIQKPHVSRYYDHILEYGDDDRMKGDFVVQALGSSALIERDLQNQFTLQLGPYTENPVYGLDPKKWMEELVKANKMDYNRFAYDDEQWKETVQRMSQPPPDPRIEVAQINAQLKQAVEQMKVADKDKDRALEMGLAEMQREFDVYIREMGDDTTMTIEAQRAKQQLADTIMKLRAQFAMQKQSGEGGQLTEPPVEPVGRAPDGQAFAK